MSRLPSIPNLEWQEGNVPFSCASDDVYYSIHDGLSETRRVFLQGCNLPQSWNNRNHFTVAELGFGTGLNFLALWQLWNENRPSSDSWLEFVSFENSPLTPEQAKRALSLWSSLNDLSDLLLQSWPTRAKGVRRIEWPSFGVGLTLHIDEVTTALPASKFTANAWFLDGFAPSRNPEMWTEEVLKCLAKRSHPNSQISTYSVAGHVRRGLEKVGFKVFKKPGHGNKRERLEATYSRENSVGPDPYGIRWLDHPPKRIAILGAGIAGATLARALTNQRYKVDVFDLHSNRSLAASRNKFALVMPRLDATDTLEAKILIDAYITARESYKGMPGVFETHVTQYPRSDKEEAKFKKLLDDAPLPEDNLVPAEKSGLLHKHCLIIKPNILIDALLQEATLINELPSKPELSDYNVVMLALGMATLDYVPWLELNPKLGQVEFKGNCATLPASALAAGHFALSLGKERFWGATFDPYEGNTSVSNLARQSNLIGLRNLNPPWLKEVEDYENESRASVRATTPDRLPLVGSIPDYELYSKSFRSYSNGTLPEIDAPLKKGWYISSGFGTRGFTWGPWAASILTAQILRKPFPATEATLKAVSPARQILRRIKRGKLAI